MYLQKLRLHNFRNYRQLSLTPPKGVTVLMGKMEPVKPTCLKLYIYAALGKVIEPITIGT